MSYYVTHNINLEVIDRKKFTQLVSNEKDKDNRYFDVTEVKLNRVKYLKSKTAKYYVGWEDYHLNYDEEEFNDYCDKIAPYVKGYIELRGEEHEVWRFVFKDGQTKFQESSTFFGFDAYEIFMEHHDTDLPETLRTELRKWNVARRL